MEPEDSLITGDENLSTIPEKEPDKFIKSSVEYLVPIPSESEDTSDRGDIDEIGVFLEIDDSFHEYEAFCFNIKEKSSVSTTTHSGYSLSDYEA
ncbi:hypothetical protein Tco_0457363, partial [Tanacetum coccineum]